MTSLNNNENNPNNNTSSMLIPIKSESDSKKLTEDEITTTAMEMEIDDNILIKEKITLIATDKNEIISKLQTFLENITLETENIKNISSYICDKIYKYRNMIIADIFNTIFSYNHVEPKVEYLCLITEILKGNFGLEKKEPHYERISSIFKKIIFPFVKSICIDLYSTLIYRNQNNVTFFLGEWERNNYFGNDFIKEIKFEIKFWTEPNITASEKDAKNLMNLVNCGNYKIEQNLIDYSRALEALNRNKDNFHRKNMLKLEKDLLQKQIRIYNTHIQQLKEINSLINKIEEHPELFEKIAIQ
jgi:hypothetical protein